MPYGKYVVAETTVPDGFEKIEPFIVEITEDSRTPKEFRVFLDREFEIYLKVYKIDADSGQLIKKEKGAVFNIYDEKRKEKRCV